MGSHGIEIDDQPTADGTPEDVAAVYSWANLQGAKYRDFSGSRREYRAQVRYRAAKALLDRELRAQAEAEAVAAEAERVAQAAAEAASQETGNKGSRIESKRSAEAAARRASAERVEAARRAEAAAHAAMVALREEREIAATRASASGRSQVDSEVEQEAEVAEEREAMRAAVPAPNPRLGDLTGDTTSYLQFPMWREELLLDSGVVGRSPQTASPAENKDTHAQQRGPAWLYATQLAPGARETETRAAADRREAQSARAKAPGSTLQDSRERVASRWVALKNVVEDASPELPAAQPSRTDAPRAPLLAVFSIAGGVGKTSLAATLGRALSAKGERVLLVDTTAYGLLPFYFGGRELAPGMSCAFAPTPEKAGAPISMVIHDATGDGGNDEQRVTLAKEILAAGPGNHRMVLDLAAGSSWLVQRLADLNPTVLVPIVPDMNSVMSLRSVERIFRGITDSEGRPVLPFYMLNQFDASLPLHLDVREVLRRQLGDRLLPFAIQSSQAVSEALAEGMTVLDYAPDAPVSQDYLDVAAWLSSISPRAEAENGSARWGEL